MEVISKGEFAARLGRSAGAISQWIAAGKLSGAALVGEGRRAKINVTAAMAQLGAGLDLGQQLAQPRPVIAANGVRRGAAADAPARLLAARADREEIALVLDRAKAEAAAGRWVDAAEVEAAWAAEMTALINATETWLVSDAAAASITAAAGGAGLREVATMLRRGYRDLRARLAEQAAGRDAADADTLNALDALDDADEIPEAE